MDPEVLYISIYGEIGYAGNHISANFCLVENIQMCKISIGSIDFMALAFFIRQISATERDCGYRCCCVCGACRCLRSDWAFLIVGRGLRCICRSVPDITFLEVNSIGSSRYNPNGDLDVFREELCF